MHFLEFNRITEDTMSNELIELLESFHERLNLLTARIELIERKLKNFKPKEEFKNGNDIDKEIKRATQ